jgi:trans-aconitate methyltransferase
MQPLLYDELVDFYHLIDPLEDHADEAEAYGDSLKAAVARATSMLELGSGAGHGAHYVKDRFEQVTLTDLSVAMLERSKLINPDCEHVVGDMRSLRLARNFDCVMIHDAICHLTTREDLRAAVKTAWVHLRSGGAALLIPDCTKESFVEYHESHAADDDQRSLRYIAWSHDPDPSDETHVTDFALLLREGGVVRAVHDHHLYGLFAKSVWLDVCRDVGFTVEAIVRPLPEEHTGTTYTDTMFLCRKA